MIKSYDQQLILEAQECFSKLYGREIKADEAESFLKSFVGLYDSLFEKE